jgi:hypothetical protein
MKFILAIMFILSTQNVMSEVSYPDTMEFSCTEEDGGFNFHFSRIKVRGIGRSEPQIKNFVQMTNQNAKDVTYHSGKGDIVTFIYSTFIYDDGRAPNVLNHNTIFSTTFTISNIPVGHSFDGFVSINQKEFFSVDCMKTK